MPDPSSSALRDYLHALYEYAVGGGEAALRRASVLQRQASAEGSSTLDIFEAHHATMLPILLPASSPEKAKARDKSIRIFCSSCPSWDHQLANKPQDRTAIGNCLQKCTAPSADPPTSPVEPLVVLRDLNQTLGEEKRPFAKIIDNEAAQLLAVAHIRLAMAARDLPFGCSHCFGEIQKFLEQIQVQLPPTMVHDPDLVSALKLVAESTLKGTDIGYTVEGSVDGTLPEAFQAVILRIAEETLTNVVRHAYAQTVKLRVQAGDEFQYSILDDGVGFDANSVLSGKSGHGVGLLGIRERVKLLGGVLSVVSSRGKGTTILVKLPPPVVEPLRFRLIDERADARE